MLMLMLMVNRTANSPPPGNPARTIVGGTDSGGAHVFETAAAHDLVADESEIAFTSGPVAAAFPSVYLVEATPTATTFRLGESYAGDITGTFAGPLDFRVENTDDLGGGEIRLNSDRSLDGILAVNDQFYWYGQSVYPAGPYLVHAITSGTRITVEANYIDDATGGGVKV